MKFPDDGQEVLAKCRFTNSYEDPYDRWLVVYYQNKKWYDTIEGEEIEVVLWNYLPETQEEPKKKPPRKNWDKESQKQLLHMIAEGKSYEEMAQVFNVSKRSVENARERYYRKKNQ